MATKSKIIHGHAFQITQPFEAGHVLTENEARALNQTRSENIGNNVREKVKELLAEGDVAGAEALVAERDASYEFTALSSGGGARRDPVENEARRLAREIIRNQLAETGRKLTVAPEGQTDEDWKAAIEGEVERISALEDVLKIARKNVEDKQKRSKTLLDAVGSVSV